MTIAAACDQRETRTGMKTDSSDDHRQFGQVNARHFIVIGHMETRHGMR